MLSSGEHASFLSDYAGRAPKGDTNTATTISVTLRGKLLLCWASFVS